MNKRNTKQKEIVLNAVSKRCDHPSAEQIAQDVQKIDPKISLGTVYRNLNSLSEEGKISAVRLSAADRFDFDNSKHNHFVCEKCKRVFDIPIQYDTKLDNISVDGFSIESHQTIFKGLCPECKNK